FRRIMLFLRRVLHPYKCFLLLRAPRHLRQLLCARAGITVENEIVVGRGDRAQRDLLIAWPLIAGRRTTCSGIACLTLGRLGIAGHGAVLRKRWNTDS